MSPLATSSVKPLTLRKTDKLRLRSGFEQVKRNGHRSASSVLVAITAPSQSLECGVICGRKFSTRAVKRNRARRLLWESFRILKPEIFPCRLVLIPRRPLLELKRPQVTMELVKLLNYRGLIRKEQEVESCHC